MTMTIRRLPDDSSDTDMIIVQFSINGNHEVLEIREYLSLKPHQRVVYAAPIGIYMGFSKVPCGLGMTFQQMPTPGRDGHEVVVFDGLELTSVIRYNQTNARFVVASIPGSSAEVQHRIDTSTIAYLIKIENGDENDIDPGLLQS